MIQRGLMGKTIGRLVSEHHHSHLLQKYLIIDSVSSRFGYQSSPPECKTTRYTSKAPSQRKKRYTVSQRDSDLSEYILTPFLLLKARRADP
jgi:hypothetical protein